MRIVVLVDNRVGRDGLRILEDLGADVVGAVDHPAQRTRVCDGILAAAALPAVAVFEVPEPATEAGRARLKAREPDPGVSLISGGILKEPARRLFPAEEKNHEGGAR
jgi:hypothetical protein